MAIPTNRTPVRVARGAAVKFTETIDGVAGAGAKELQDGEIVWDETNEKFQLKVGGSSSTTLKDHTVDTTDLAPKASPTFTGTVTGPTINASTALQIGGVAITSSSAELNILDGVTATAAELNYSDGVTSNIQTQIDTKAPLASPTFTGAVNIGDDVVANWGATLDGRIFYENSTDEFHIRTPGGTADIIIGGGANTKFTNEDGNTEYARINSSGGFVLKKSAVGEITDLTLDGTDLDTNFALSNNFQYTMAGNYTLAQPTNQVAGQSGSIFLTQDGTGSRTLAYHADWKWAGGTAPTLSTTAAAVDRIDYIVAAANKIHAVVTLAVA